LNDDKYATISKASLCFLNSESLLGDDKTDKKLLTIEYSKERFYWGAIAENIYFTWRFLVLLQALRWYGTEDNCNFLSWYVMPYKFVCFLWLPTLAD
jgi:hypothetical protein